MNLFSFLRSLYTDQVKSVLKGAAIALAGALLTYASQWASGQDFGQWAPIITAALGIAANIVRKWSGMP
jgi:hypothetical protein